MLILPTFLHKSPKNFKVYANSSIFLLQKFEVLIIIIIGYKNLEERIWI